MIHPAAPPPTRWSTEPKNGSRQRAYLLAASVLRRRCHAVMAESKVFLVESREGKYWPTSLLYMSGVQQRHGPCACSCAQSNIQKREKYSE
jgi:hypothetical protein